MVFQTYPRLVLALLGPGVVASMFACGGPGPQADNQVRRHGDDVLASGSAPRVADSVPGDAMLAGGQPFFSGATGGDYLGMGGDQTIGGRIHGSVRAAGGKIDVTAAVGRNATIAGGNVTLERTAVVEKNVSLAGGVIQADGAVHGGLQVAGGTVTLNGVVGQDVDVTAGELRVGPDARISGNLQYRVPAGKVRIDPAARVSGRIIALPVPQGRGIWMLFGILWLLGFLVVGTVLVLLIPRFAAAAATIQRRPGYSALVGLGWLVIIPVAVIVAAITIIGLPLAFLTVGVYLILWCVSRVPVAIWLGDRLLGNRAGTGRTGVLVNFLVGGVLLLLVRSIPVIGGLAMLVATVLGVGALLLHLRTETGTGTGVV